MMNDEFVTPADDAIEDRMLDGLELLYYSSRYAGETFVICFLCEAQINNLFYDLRILQLSGIRSIVLVSEESEHYRESGTVMNLLYPHSFQITENHSEILEKKLTGDLTHDHLLICHAGADNAVLKKTAFQTAETINSRKVILITGENKPLITIDKNPVSHTDPSRLRKSLQSVRECSPDKNILIELCDSAERHPCDTIIMGSITGGIFSEIFTYRGFGSLLSMSYSNLIKKGTESDLIDIMMIMRPDIVSNAILPMDIEEIRKKIRSFYLYTVDQSIVAICRLVEYDNACELAKFCTLPRYRGKGRAKELVQYLIKEAKKLNKDYVFSLSTIEKMWEFYLSMDFKEAPRESLPKSWQKNYNFDRPSKAFVYHLN